MSAIPQKPGTYLLERIVLLVVLYMVYIMVSITASEEIFCIHLKLCLMGITQNGELGGGAHHVNGRLFSLHLSSTTAHPSSTLDLISSYDDKLVQLFDVLTARYSLEQ